MRSRVAGNLIWMIVERGLQVGIGICVVAMLARALGPERFARFQYAQSVVLVAGSMAFVCSAEVLVPRLVSASSTLAQGRLLAHAFVLRLLGAAGGYALMLAFLGLTSAPLEVWQAALLLGTTFILREPFGVVIAWMQAHINNRPSTLMTLTALVVKVAIVTGLYVAGIESIAGYAAAFAVEAVVLAMLLSAYYLLNAPTQKILLRVPLMHDLATSGALFWASFMLMLASRRVDQLVLQPVVPASTFGAYAACMQILDNFTLLATILATGMAPAYVYRITEWPIALRNVLRITAVLAVAGLLGGGTIALLAPWIVHLLYGSAFAPAATLLRVAALISVLVFVDVGLTLIAVHLRRPLWIVMKWAVVLAGSLAVDLWLIPRHGVWGAMAGYATSYLLASAAGIVMILINRPSIRPKMA